MTETTDKKVHQGRNVKRFREMLGMKQEALAMEPGEDWNQKKDFFTGNKGRNWTRVAGAGGEGVESTEWGNLKFDELAAINIISNTFHAFKDNSVANANHCTFNPLDKVIELYERMLKDKTDMIERLERMLLKKWFGRLPI